MTQNNKEIAINSVPFKYFFSCDAGEAFTAEQIYDGYLEYGEEDETFYDFCSCLTCMGSETMGFFTLEELEEFALDYTNESEIRWHQD